MAKHRGIDYSVIQGLEPRCWKWEIALPDGRTKVGQSCSRIEAVRAAERAIERLLLPVKIRLMPRPNPPR